jgi:opacity protein-like surface antigen
VLAVQCCSCSPYAFAPPIRSTHYGAPGKLEPGQIEIAGAFNATPALSGGPQLSYAVNEWFQVEAGGELSDGAWGLGFAAARFTPVNARRGIFRLAVDIDLGVGIGLGGELSCLEEEEGVEQPPRCLENQEHPREWNERLAAGSYVGGGIAFHVSFFSIFARGRVQVSFSEGLPMTLWGSSVVGLAFDILSWVDLYGAVGVAGLHNDMFAVTGFIAEVGVSVTIPTRRADQPVGQRVVEAQTL